MTGSALLTIQFVHPVKVASLAAVIASLSTTYEVAPWQKGLLKDYAIDKILDRYLPELAVVLHTRDIIW
jgi:hypothetical protein